MRHLEAPRSARVALLLSTALVLAGVAGGSVAARLPGAKPAATPAPTPVPDARSRPRRPPTRPAPPPAPSSSSRPARATSRARRAISSCRRARRRAARSWPGGSAPCSSATSTSTSTRSRRSRRATRRTACPRGWTRSATVPDGRGGQDPVFIVRSRDAAGSYWAFSRQTVSRIDGWYDALPDRWVRDWMPERLQRYGPADLMWWQWLALPALLAPGPRPRAGPRRLHRGRPPPARSGARRPSGTSGCSSGPSPALTPAVGGGGGRRAAALARAAARGPPLRPVAPRRGSPRSPSSGPCGARWTCGPSSSWRGPGRRRTPPPGRSSP